MRKFNAVSALMLTCFLIPATYVQAQSSSSGRNRPDLNGRLVRNPLSGAIYWIDQGKSRHIVSMPVYQRLFVTRDRDYLDTDAVKKGLPITDDNRLVRCGEKGHPLFGGIYLLDNGKKRHIISLQALEKNNFNISGVADIDCPLLKAIPNGTKIR